MGTASAHLAVGIEMTPFWQEVNDLRATLSEKSPRNNHGRPFVYITSLGDKYRGLVGGVTVEANIDVAARALAQNAQGGATHRLSTPEEATKFKDDQKFRALEMAKIAEANKPVTVLRLEGSRNEDGSVDLKPINSASGQGATNNNTTSQEALKGDKI